MLCKKRHHFDFHMYLRNLWLYNYKRVQFRTYACSNSAWSTEKNSELFSHHGALYIVLKTLGHIETEGEQNIMELSMAD